MSDLKKDFTAIADSILCGVDYDIYKDDCNEMDNELRDEIECKLIGEFGCFDEMYVMLARWINSVDCVADDYQNEIKEETLELLSKVRGE